jgi:hypothetical protein
MQQMVLLTVKMPSHIPCRLPGVNAREVYLWKVVRPRLKHLSHSLPQSPSCPLEVRVSEEPKQAVTSMPDIRDGNFSASVRNERIAGSASGGGVRHWVSE